MVNTISAVVHFVDSTSGKCRVATEITIKLGTLDVAYATLGGRWGQAQALAEFKRNPQNFTAANGILESTKLSLADFKAAA